MKLKTVLTEGTRFGNREMNAVKRNTNVRIGNEYEFILDPDFSTVFMVDSKYEHYRKNPKITRVIEVDRETVIGKARFHAVAWVKEQIEPVLKEFEQKIDPIFEMLDIFAGWSGDVEELNRIVDGVRAVNSNPHVKRFIAGKLFNGELPDFFTDKNTLQSLIDMEESAITEFEFEMDHISPTEISKLSLTKRTLFEEFEKYMKLMSLNTTAYNNKLKEFMRQFDSSASIDEDSVRTAILYNSVNFVKFLIENNNPWGIDPNLITKVTHDISISEDHNAEVVTVPLQPKQAEEQLNAIFSMVRDIGYTDNTTAVHVNVSIKGIPFSNKKFNPVKLMALVDNQFIQSDVGFKVREYTSDFWDRMLTEDSLSQIITHMSNPSDVDTVIDIIQDHIILELHGAAVFFTDAFSDVGKNAGRIEFRQIGDADYEFRVNTILWHMYRFSHATLAAFDEEYMKNSYKKSIMKLIDTFITRKFNYKSLADMYRTVHQQKRQLP